ncbi:hypothetical protein SLA2020_030360 [Shorea laevis]
MNCHEWIDYNLSSNVQQCAKMSVWTGVEHSFPYIYWYLWLGRKRASFDEDLRCTSDKEAILKHHFLEVAVYLKTQQTSPKPIKLVGWEPPP